jgi:peptide/bleomycin uptake transporter
VFRSFFPEPRIFFPAAIAWTTFFMAVWFLFNGHLEPFLSIAPMFNLPAGGPDAPFLNADRIWTYEYVLLTGYLFCVPWYFYGSNRRWLNWSTIGSVTIFQIVYFNVQISAWLNDWYGEFFNLIQNALANPNTISLDEFIGFIWTVIVVLVVNITMQVINAFLVAHFLFRWRRAMSFFYMANWKSVRHVEGASQRIQEDTRDFVSIVERLGISFVDAVMTLIVFLPILWALSAKLIALPWIGFVEGGLVWVALGTAVFGTVLLWVAGIRLPGLNFHNQRVEASFRKELVYGEDHDEHARPVAVRDFFKNVQRNYFRLYFNYTYFNVARYAYIQGSNFIAVLAMAPSIVAGAITFGIFRQIQNAFDQVFQSFKFLVNSWTSIIDLISIHKRLVGFEANLPAEPIFANDYDDERYLESWDKQPDPDPETTPVDFQWALVRQPGDGDIDEGYVSVWYDLADRQRYPGSRTRETTFPYSRELADQVASAMNAIRSGEKVSAILEFFEQRERIKLVVPGPGAIDEIDTSQSEKEAPDKRIRPINMAFPDLASA